jgi:hypothetical protein
MQSLRSKPIAADLVIPATTSFDAGTHLLDHLDLTVVSAGYSDGAVAMSSVAERRGTRGRLSHHFVLMEEESNQG